MGWTSKARYVAAWAIGGGCAWEVVALASGDRLPTITDIVHRIRRHPVGYVAVAAACGWLAHHLLVEEAQL